MRARNDRKMNSPLVVIHFEVGPGPSSDTNKSHDKLTLPKTGCRLQESLNCSRDGLGSN